MMNLLQPFLLFALLISLSFSSFSKHFTNSLTENHLKGKVKKMIVNEYDGILENGRVVASELRRKFQHGYDERGNYIMLDAEYGKGTSFKNKYDYNGNVIEVKQYDSTGNLGYIKLFTYNSRGYLIEEKTDGGCSLCFTKSVYTNNQKGFPISQISYYRDGTRDFNNSMNWKYDERNNVILCFNQSYKHGYKYDTKDNLIQETWYELNDNTKAFYISDEVKYSYVEFDAIGNWLKAIVYHNNKLLKIIEREIQYY